MNVRSRLTARNSDTTSSSVTPAMTYRPLRAASSVRVIVARICRNSSCSRASSVATMVRMPSEVSFARRRKVVSGGWSGALRRLSIPVTMIVVRSEIRDTSSSMSDSSVVSSRILSRSDDSRAGARRRPRFELLDERIVAGDHEAAARGFHVVDGCDQAVEVVGRFGIPRGRFGQLS